MEIKSLIKRAKKGDKEALLQLVMNQKNDYYKLAYIYMKNEEDALDVIQDMIVILYENIHKLKKDDSFDGNYDVNKVVELNKGDIRKNINILEQDIIINKIYESEGNTYINITTDENLTLSKVLLDIDGEKVKPEKTIPGDYEKTKHTRTIEFRGTGEKLSLEIESIRYNKEYDKLIYSYE
ncbi:RNA polymerase sigma factor [Clostridium sp. Cult2]|uniref:RNA polymerase sigma factor n=1 Tax=Clostridium sp. Cult2 TaxID=2079003 RepID=UPI001F3BABB8|nr:RNA polymerase subunit sigma-24 [Clostridium sp. Cult2]